jgi:pimeloyl-ACP methyl ester carboxylesterase
MLKQLIDELGLDRPVLISPSMSGAYSLPLLMRWPDSIRALIAIAPSNSADYGAEEYARTTVCVKHPASSYYLLYRFRV